MSALDRKLLRDVLAMKGQLIAICLVIACGVATFVMGSSVRSALISTRDAYYERYRFPDLFLHLKRAPNALLSRIRDIPGIDQFEERVVMDVTLDIPGLGEPAIGRLISIPERREPALGTLFLRAGRLPDPNRPDEVLANEGFMQAHGYVPGDAVSAVINGRLRDLQIVGVALTPEYIYVIRPGQLVPDNRRFGVFWMGRKALGTAFDMDGAFNNLTLSVSPAADAEEIIDRLDHLTEPYGGLGAFDRESQVSHRFLTDEIGQLRKMGMLVPTIFLGVAAFLLNVVLSRIIALQRDQIAALKAFGYSNWAVGWHYLKLVLTVVVIGILIGTAFGCWLGLHITGIYMNFYKFPELSFRLPPDVVAWAFLVAGGAGVLGTLGVIRQAVRLPPAEAMRPEPPATFRPFIVERLGLTFLLSPATRMIVRHLERRPFKAFLSAFGIGLSIAIIVLGRFSADAIDVLLESQFQVQERQDMTVSFVEPRALTVVHDLERLPGVVRTEPFRGVPTRLESAQRMRRVVVQGLLPERELTHLVDVAQRPIAIPPEGLMLNTKLASLLEVGVGDVVTVHVLEGARPVRLVKVSALTTQYIGTSAYMDLRALNRLLGEGEALSGAQLLVDAARADALYRDLKAAPRVASVIVKDSSIRSFRDTIAENMLVMQRFNLMFACIIAFGVVYNTARIALSERGRELASLRVMGFTRGEISGILLGELAMLTVAAIPLGIGFGCGLAKILSLMMDTEMYRIPFVINPETLGLAVSVVLVAATISGLIVRRKLDHLDLIAVLKTRE